MTYSNANTYETLNIQEKKVNHGDHRKNLNGNAGKRLIYNS